MRITGGKLRSRKLLSIDAVTLRPATDRLRETMFDILSNIIAMEDAAVLDLYAGTGSVGLEAISRGASCATFVESDRKTADVLKRNAIALGVDKNCSVFVTTVDRFLRSCKTKFDIAFVDPPYAINEGTHEIVDELLSKRVVSPEGVICVEHSKAYSPAPSLLIRQRIFGATILSIIKPETIWHD